MNRINKLTGPVYQWNFCTLIDRKCQREPIIIPSKYLNHLCVIFVVIQSVNKENYLQYSSLLIINNKIIYGDFSFNRSYSYLHLTKQKLLFFVCIYCLFIKNLKIEQLLILLKNIKILNLDGLNLNEFCEEIITYKKSENVLSKSSTICNNNTDMLTENLKYSQFLVIMNEIVNIKELLYIFVRINVEIENNTHILLG